MIRHVSLPARDPERVARALAELTGGRALPFGSARGFMVATGDAVGTGIEVVADTVALAPGEGDGQVRFVDRAPDAAASPFHLLLSVPVGRDVIEAIGKREGWRTRHFWRGSGDRRDFELIELWLENRVLLELMTPEMGATYEAHMREAIHH